MSAEARNWVIQFNVEYYKKHKKYPDSWVIAESYAREYHAKEMQRKLEEVEKLFDGESKKKKTDVVKTIFNNGATFVIARLKEQNT